MSTRQFAHLIFMGLAAYAATGCTFYLGDVESLVPEPPPLAQAAPRLSQLTVIPSTLSAGASTLVTVRFRYEDWNEDVGPQRAKVLRHLEVLSGNIAFLQPSRELWVEVNHHGRYGFVEFSIEFFVPSEGFGQIQLSVFLYDNSGNRSNPVSALLNVR